MTSNSKAPASGNTKGRLLDLHAVVIGGGPAGLSCAMGLSKTCRKVTIVEKHDTFDVRGATLGLQPNGLKALAELSLEKETASERNDSSKKSTLINRLEEVGVTTSWGGFLLPWWQLRDILLERVRMAPNVEILMGKYFTNIIDKTQENVVGTAKPGVEVHFQCEGQIEILEADFVVGADGVNSNVRQWLGLPAAVETGTRSFRGSCTIIDENNKNLQVSNELLGLLEKGLLPLSESFNAFGGVYFFLSNFHEKSPGLLSWTFTFTQPCDFDNDTPFTILEKYGNGLSKEMRSLMEEIFHLPTDQNMNKVTRGKIIDLQDDYDGRWGGRGLVTLTGDAAHAMRPADGQGANQSFEDSVALSRIFEKYLEGQSGLRSNNHAGFEVDSNAVEDLLRNFELSRFQRVLKIHECQRKLAEKRMNGESATMTEDFKQWLFAGI